MKHAVLLVDDDTELLESLVRLLATKLEDTDLFTASDAQMALSTFEKTTPAVAIIDLSLNEQEGIESGFQLLQRMLALDISCRIIVLTGHGSVEHGVRAISLGAAHFLDKPADVNHLQVLVKDGIAQSRYMRAMQELTTIRTRTLDDFFIGSSEAITTVKEQILFAASHELPVIINGETGTGKGLCAQAIHELSERAPFSFVRYQPASSSSDLIHSELFGHKKGAFTGAQADRKGLIANAENGTLFLDEIDEFPIDTQVFLLGVLQEKKYRSVGEDREKSTNFRLLSATNTDIEKSLEDGKIRKDFYHRIAHSRIQLPPLRERTGDIFEITDYIFKDLQNERQIYINGFDESAKSSLRTYNWPGNIRELISVVENAAHFAWFQKRDVITAADLMLSPSSDSNRKQLTFNEQVAAYKKKLAQSTLDECNGNQVHAARQLGIDRSTLRRILAYATG